MRLTSWLPMVVVLAAPVLLRAQTPAARWFDLRPAVAPEPVFADQKAFTPEGIAGVWVEQTDSYGARRLSLTAKSDASGPYLECVFTGSAVAFRGQFYQAGGRLLLEMSGTSSTAEPFVLPATFWWGVSYERNVLTLRPLSLDLADAIAAGRVQLAHRELKQAWLITAEPAAVRAVLSGPLAPGHGDDLVLHRQ